MTYYSTVMRDAPSVYYPLGEASGVTASDASGNGWNGTYSGSGVTYGVASPVFPATAITLNGVAGKCTCPVQVDPGGWAAITIEYWMKLSTTTLPSSPAIVANDLVATSLMGIMTSLNADATALNFLLGNETVAPQCSGGFAFATGQWYHIACAWDGTNMRVYVNSALKGGPTAFAGPIAPAGSDVTIGHNPAGADFFTGSIAQFAMYRSALTADQVKRHYQARVPGGIARRRRVA